jgi:flagellar hook-length control protein FliK
MMLPAVTAMPMDSATGSADSAVDPADGAGGFAAAIAQLRGAVPAAPSPTDTLSLENVEIEDSDAALIADPVPSIPIEAIDWLLGQRTSAGTESLVATAAEGVPAAGPTGSAPGATLVQMLAWRSTLVAPAAGSADANAVVTAESGVVSGLPGQWATDISSMTVVDSQPFSEAVLTDELLTHSLEDNRSAEDSMLFHPDRSGSPSVDSPSAPQMVRAEAAARIATAALHTPVGTRAWNDELASKLTWLIDRGEQLATLRVTPDSLGPIDIRIAVREGEASIWFGASQADTRQAIEQAIPRLREMLASQGLSLSDAGVFQQAPNDPQRALLRNDLRRAAQESGEAAPVQSAALPRRPGLIDDYA